MGALADAETIPFTVRSGQEGTVMIQLEEGTSLPEGFCAVFEDLETGEKAGLGGDPLIVELEPNHHLHGPIHHYSLICASF